MATPQAAAADRELYLYYTHTKETARITFKRNGRYDQAGLKKLNYFLRDWRRDEPAKMDPALFDLIWEVYQEVGATKPVYVVSAYRAPETNEMLRSRSSGVAKNSRHTMGMAMDFYIPGVPLDKLRAVAFKKQVGGVGYYPTSGSPFVHLDTGNVRAWPRMTRSQLARIFPDGKTLHIPSDGKLLSQEGYNYAKAQWTRCHQVPCTSGSRGNVRVASAASNDDGRPQNTLFGWLFGEEGDEGDEVAANAPVTVASVKTTAVPNPPAVAPTPMAWPADLRGTPPVAVAAAQAGDTPTPLARPDWRLSVEAAEKAPVAVAAVEPPVFPAARPEDMDQSTPVLTAYAPTPAPEPDAQRAVEMILEQRLARADAEAVPTEDPVGELIDAGLRTAAAAGANELPDVLNTTTPVSRPADLKAAEIALVAPDFQHVTDMFSDPATVESARFAFINTEVSGGLDGATQLGSTATQLTFGDNPAHGLSRNSFSRGGPLLVAQR